jgi:hypothetical protein
MQSASSTTNVLLILLWLALVAVSLAAVRDIAHRTPVIDRRHPTAATAAKGCTPTDGAYLRLRLRAADQPDLDIDWKDADMQCEGGLRPEGRGIRMVFAGALPDGHQLRVVFGMATAADVIPARNVPTNLTVIFEDEQKLFSTAGDGKCTIDALTLQVSAGRRWLAARGFCTEPAIHIGGSDTLLVDRFDFAGVAPDEKWQRD